MDLAVFLSRATLYLGDVRAVLRGLPEASIQTVVTSPPYWGLRAYGTHPQVWGGDSSCEHDWNAVGMLDPRGLDNRGSKSTIQGSQRPDARGEGRGDFCPCGAWRGELGLEPTPALFIAHMVEVFAEVSRVLRPDGTLWLNIGDSYVANHGAAAGDLIGTDGYRRNNRRERQRATVPPSHSLKPKDMVGVPWMLAFALREAGWWLRSDIIWAKPNPMPESVTDRPTKSHEYVFLLSKSERYFYDADAIAEPAGYADEARWDPGTNGLGGADRKTGKSTRRFRKVETTEDRRARAQPDHKSAPTDERNGIRKTSGNLDRKFDDAVGRPISHLGRSVPWDNPGTRNVRTVWSVATQPYKGAHFATFPEELARRCILAGTSAKGHCPSCGAPWKRQVIATGGTKGRAWHDHSGDSERGQRITDQDGHHGRNGKTPYKREDRGFSPGCGCGAEPVPDVVLDPFGGSGTVAQVATGNGRTAIHIDLNPKYMALAQERIGPLLCNTGLP